MEAYRITEFRQENSINIEHIEVHPDIIRNAMTYPDIEKNIITISNVLNNIDIYKDKCRKPQEKYAKSKKFNLQELY